MFLVNNAAGGTGGKKRLAIVKTAGAPSVDKLGARVYIALLFG